VAARAHGTFLERDEFALAAAGQSFCVRGSFSDGQLGPTNTARSVRKVSLRYPVIEARPEGSPTAAGIGPRQVLDGLRVLCLATVDAEARLWSMTSSQFARVWKRILTMAGVRYRHPAKPQRPDPRRPEGGWLEYGHHALEGLRALGTGRGACKQPCKHGRNPAAAQDSRPSAIMSPIRQFGTLPKEALDDHVD
jgi:hypothetical protein